MEAPLDFTRPEKERKGSSFLKEVYERIVLQQLQEDLRKQRWLQIRRPRSLQQLLEDSQKLRSLLDRKYEPIERSLLDRKYEPIETEQDRADSPEPSRVSMKSDRSMNNPLSFKQQHSKVQQETSDVSTGRRSPLDSTFMFLEENIVGFVKKELNKFKEMLSPDYPECPEDQCEDEGVVDEEEAQRRYGSALVLKMTLLFMKRMNLGELADSLEKRSVRLLDSVAESKLHNGAFTGLMSAVNMLFSTCFK